MRVVHNDAERGYGGAVEPYAPPLSLIALSMPRLVREARDMVGLTQAGLARAAGISRDRIARLECGAGGTRLRDVEAVLAALDEAGIILRPDGRPDLRDASHWRVG